MELYFVNDMVKLINLEEEWAKYQKTRSPKDKPSPDVTVELNYFPSMMRPVVDSKSNRDFVGKLRDVIKRDYKFVDAKFSFHVGRNKRPLYAIVEFKVSRHELSGDEGSFLIFEENNWAIWMRLSLCHLPTKNSPVPPADHLYTLTMDMEHSLLSASYSCFTSDKEDVEEALELWDHETGYIYAKLTVGLTLNEEDVETIMMKGKPIEYLKGIGAMTRKMLEEEICTDLEIRCGDGGIVKGHKAVLGGMSKVFHKMFEAEEMEEARTGKLEMEEMSEQGVRAFLRWIYWRDEKEALEESNVAVEMLIAGDKYDLEGLVGEMNAIVLERRGCDEKWFGVESAVKLYRWARDLKGLNEFKEKAVHVLKFFEKMCPEKLEESEDYQDLIKNDGDASAAMEISEEDDDEDELV